MEPAPLTADEIVGPTAPPLPGLVHDGDTSHAAGEDVEPPYLRLRTLVDETLSKESQVRDSSSPYPPDLDLTEFATLAENTGVEVARRDTPPPLPRTLIADVASFPHAMPTSIEPATELVIGAKSRLAFSRTRLVGWGAVAFCAGLLASAAAHMLVAPARLGQTANAATTNENVVPPAPASSAATPATVPAVAPAPAPAPAIAVVPVPAPAAEAPTAKSTATETARAEVPELALAASPAPVRTRSGASPLSRGQARARGKMRSRSVSASAAEIAGETDAPPSDESGTEAATAPPARAKHPAPGWVDPFAP